MGFVVMDKHANGVALVKDILKISWAAYTVIRE